jgi:hypothetical protein
MVDGSQTHHQFWEAKVKLELENESPGHRRVGDAWFARDGFGMCKSSRKKVEEDGYTM